MNRQRGLAPLIDDAEGLKHQAMRARGTECFRPLRADRITSDELTRTGGPGGRAVPPPRVEQPLQGRDDADALLTERTPQYHTWAGAWTNLTAQIISALIGAAVAGVIGWLASRQAQLRESRQELRGILIDLLDLRERFLKELQAIGDIATREDLGSILSNKRSVYLAIAESVERRVRRGLSPHDYVTLADECAYESNFTAAETYYRRAISKLKRSNAFDRAIVLRATGAFYSGPGPQKDGDRADRYFQDAITATSGIDSPYMLFQTAVTYESWAWWLASSRRSGWREKLDHARSYYERLSANDPMRAEALSALDWRTPTIEALATQPVAAVDRSLTPVQPSLKWPNQSVMVPGVAPPPDPLEGQPAPTLPPESS